MDLNRCKRMTVTALGLDEFHKVVIAQNGNEGECTGEKGKCGCVHAEQVLLQQMTNPMTVIISHSPCLSCAKSLVKAKVQNVFYHTPYRDPSGVFYLEEHGVVVKKI